MKIKDIPEQNRPRERFKSHGAEALSDAELMAIILRTGTPKENAIEVSNNLMNKYPLDKLFDCSLKELQEIKGIGQSKAMQLLAVSELGKRYNHAKQKPITKISSPEDVFHHMKYKLEGKKQEEFHILILNNQNTIVETHMVSKGILDAAIIHPREVFKPAIKNSASKIILVHNHPSGNPNPSPEDLNITSKLKEAGKLLDIAVLDHIIVAGDKWWSEVER